MPKQTHPLLWGGCRGGRVSGVCSLTSSMVSPFPSLIPKFLFLLSGPKHVPNVSPTPLSPASVLGSAPMYSPSLLISAQPRVTREAWAFIPRFRPSHIPEDMAMTFLTEPPTSTPTTSEDVKTRKVEEESTSAKSLASFKNNVQILFWVERERGRERGTIVGR